MLTIHGVTKGTYCDNISRRNFLSIGSLAMGGAAMPDLLRAEAAGGDRKAIIMVFLAGGPPHQDMVDIKEEAPAEIRGEFSAINTSVPGIRICEHMPRMAANMEKFAIIRSLADAQNSHSNYQTETGRWQRKGTAPSGDWPSIGAVLAKFKGSRDGVPPYTAMNNSRTKGGFLGSAYNPFNPRGRGRTDLSLNGVTLDRLDDRRGLLASFDRFRRDVDRSGTMEGLDAFNRQAFEVITSSRLVKALDLKNEDPKVLERYRKASKGRNDLDSFLLARRLVEAGSRCVTLNYGGWDTHGDNFKKLRTQLPKLDHGLTCLVEDLHATGLDRDVSVIVWGEFGRTPKVNSKAGRDHWNKSSMAIVAGGGMRTGQVIGATDRTGSVPAERPVYYGEIFATLYRNCGLDPAKLVAHDFSGRPHYLVDPKYQAIPELA